MTQAISIRQMEQCSIVQQSENLGEPVEQDHEHVLEWRHARKYQNRPIYRYNSLNGLVIGPGGAMVTIPSSTELTTLLEKIEDSVTKKSDGKRRAATLYLVAGRSIENRNRRGINREWFNVLAHHGWKKDEDKFFWNKLQAEYEHSGFKVYLIGTGNFFGEETDLDKIYKAWGLLEQKLEKAFNMVGYPVLRSTPAAAGRELLIASLPEGKRWWPNLSRQKNRLN